MRARPPLKPSTARAWVRREWVPPSRPQRAPRRASVRVRVPRRSQAGLRPNPKVPPGLPPKATVVAPTHVVLRSSPRRPSLRRVGAASHRRSSCSDAQRRRGPRFGLARRRPASARPGAMHPMPPPSSSYAVLRPLAVPRPGALRWPLAAGSRRAIRRSIGTSRPRLESVPRKMDRLSRRFDLSTRSIALCHRGARADREEDFVACVATGGHWRPKAAKGGHRRHHGPQRAQEPHNRRFLVHVERLRPGRAPEKPGPVTNPGAPRAGTLRRSCYGSARR